MYSVRKFLPKNYLGTLISLGAIIWMWRSHQRLKTKKCHMVSWILCFTLWFPLFYHFSPFFGLFMLFIHIQLIQKSSHSFTNGWKNHEILSDKSLRTQDLDLIRVFTNPFIVRELIGHPKINPSKVELARRSITKSHENFDSPKQGHLDSSTVSRDEYAIWKLAELNSYSK